MLFSWFANCEYYKTRRRHALEGIFLPYCWVSCFLALKSSLPASCSWKVISLYVQWKVQNNVLSLKGCLWSSLCFFSEKSMVAFLDNDTVAHQFEQFFSVSKDQQSGINLYLKLFTNTSCVSCRFGWETQLSSKPACFGLACHRRILWGWKLAAQPWVTCSML